MNENLVLTQERNLEDEILQRRLEIEKQNQEKGRLAKLAALDKSFSQDVKDIENVIREIENQIQSLEIAQAEAKKKEESELAKVKEEARKRQAPVFDRLKKAHIALVDEAQNFISDIDRAFKIFYQADTEERIALKLWKEVSGEGPGPQYCLLEFENEFLGHSWIGEGGGVTHIQEIIWKLRNGLEKDILGFNRLHKENDERKLGYKVKLPGLQELKPWGNPGG